MSKKNRLKLEEYYNLIRNSKQVDVSKMKDEAEELLRYSYQCNDTYGQAFAFVHLAIYHVTLHRLDSARFNLEKAKTLCLHENYDDLLLSCYFYEGTICQLSGNKIKAIRVYGQTKDLAEKQHENNTLISILYNNIALILMDYNDTELAKEYFELAADKLIHLPKQNYNLAQVYSNLAHVCGILQDLTAARYYLEKAKQIKCENEKAFSSIKASEIFIYAQEHDVLKVMQAYAEYQELMNNCKTSKSLFSADILLVVESLLIADLKESCHDLLISLEKLLEPLNDLELELQLYKLYIRFQETYAEESTEIYEKYYHLLLQSENQEYCSLEESLRGRIKLFEMNQNQSILEKENEVLQKQAHLDEMTGIFNRRYFDKLLLKINADSNVQNIGCIMLDIDYFKGYNDTYGHLQGDQILKKVATILTKHVVDGIYVGRFGGDEFYCLCADLQDAQIEKYLINVNDDLREQRIEHRVAANHIVTLSAGFCNEEKASVILSEVLDHADQALYKAKENGRNCFARYKKLQEAKE